MASWPAIHAHWWWKRCAGCWRQGGRGFARGTESAELAIEVQVERALDELVRPSLRRVINATGVVLHTNLGRAPLGPQQAIAGYSNLEYDLGAGKRGKRDVHAGVLLERLLGRPAIAVNNNAAAIYLALNELAAGYEVIVSRGELIEIGDGFRIPEIMSRSGAVLCEVGTTNRTSIHDYRDAITERTRLLLRVHPSNFRIEGFTARPELAELAALGRERGIPVYEDLGSGCVVDLRPVRRGRAAGARRVCGPVRIWFRSAAINCWAGRRRAFWRVRRRS